MPSAREHDVMSVTPARRASRSLLFQGKGKTENRYGSLIYFFFYRRMGLRALPSVCLATTIYWWFKLYQMDDANYRLLHRGAAQVKTSSHHLQYDAVIFSVFSLKHIFRVSIYTSLGPHLSVSSKCGNSIILAQEQSPPGARACFVICVSWKTHRHTREWGAPKKKKKKCTSAHALPFGG